MKEADHFAQHGYFILDLPDPTPVHQVRETLLKEIQTLFGKEATLENYHTFATDENHTDFQVKLTEFYRQTRLGPQIISAQKAFFQELLGPDLFVQANPYLRLARPGKKQDNIGYHRDTFYGGSPYELSVMVPFLDLPAEGSLAVLPGSHIKHEDYYPTHQVESESVTKGSATHKLGFLYAPKLMDPEINSQMKSIPLKVGQALIFSLATVHGSIENRATATRWSSDIRVMNALAPVDLSARPDYYETLSLSPITQAVKTYEQADRRDRVELEHCH